MDNILPILIVLANWSIPSFIEKKTLTLIPPRDITINKYVIGGTISLFILLCLGKSYNLENNKKTYVHTFLLTLLSILSHIMYYRLLSKMDASTLMIILNPINILITAFLGWYVAGELFNAKMLSGIAGIVIGLVLFLKGKAEIN